MTAEQLVSAVTCWAEGRIDIQSVVLVGSHARGEARSDSDVDLVILCARPELYLQQQSWIHEFGVARDVSVEDWGNVQSIRVFYADGPEVEYGITSSRWATLPLDDGTRQVLKDGAAVLLDRDGGLTRALDTVRESA